MSKINYTIEGLSGAEYSENIYNGYVDETIEPEYNDEEEEFFSLNEAVSYFSMTSSDHTYDEDGKLVLVFEDFESENKYHRYLDSLVITEHAEFTFLIEDLFE